MDDEKKCLFCKIANGEHSETRILLDKDDIVIFQDIRPAATHHYLVVPKTHIHDAKHLKKQDSYLVETMVKLGQDFLLEHGGDLDDARLGFHWPPFHSIAHLHLHVLSPQSEMGWIAGAIFKPNSWWFKTPHWLLQRLKEMA